jgi:hypothetical protein
MARFSEAPAAKPSATKDATVTRPIPPFLDTDDITRNQDNKSRSKASLLRLRFSQFSQMRVAAAAP